MEKTLFKIDGTQKGTLDLENSVFEIPFNESVVYYSLHNELANKRVGTASGKTRAEVHGTNRKPWPQKHTGKAPSGDMKSPIWRKGGLAFPPKMRDYSYHLPKNVKKLAFKSLLSYHANREDCKFVEDFSIDSGKTRDLLVILQKFFEKQVPKQKKEGYGKRQLKYRSTLIILKDDDVLLKRAARNIPWLKFQAYNRLSVHSLCYCPQIIIMESAASLLGGFYSK